MSVNLKTLTAANCNLLVRCVGIYDQYVKIRGFQVDNAFGFGDQTIGEVRDGVDAILSGGYTFNSSQFTVFLEANSPSLAVMDNCATKFKKDKETLPFDFIVEIPSIKKRYPFSGFMITAPSGVSAQKMLNGVQYVFGVDNTIPEDIN